MYDLLFEQVSSEAPLTLKKERTSLERSIYDLRKKSAFNIKEVHNIVTNMHERRLCINDNGNDVIFPQVDEVKDVIAFFYRTYRGEGANKLVARVERCWSFLFSNPVSGVLSIFRRPICATCQCSDKSNILSEHRDVDIVVRSIFRHIRMSEQRDVPLYRHLIFPKLHFKLFRQSMFCCQVMPTVTLVVSNRMVH